MFNGFCVLPELLRGISVLANFQLADVEGGDDSGSRYSDHLDMLSDSLNFTDLWDES